MLLYHVDDIGVTCSEKNGAWDQDHYQGSLWPIFTKTATGPECSGYNLFRTGHLIPSVWVSSGELIVCDAVRNRLAALGQPRFLPVHIAKLVDVPVPSWGNAKDIDFTSLPDEPRFAHLKQPYWAISAEDTDHTLDDIIHLEDADDNSFTCAADEHYQIVSTSLTLLARQPITAIFGIVIREDAMKWMAPLFNPWFENFTVYEV